MKALFIVLFGLSILFSAILASTTPFDLKAFEEALSENQYVLVNFRTTWSEPSRTFDPIFAQAAEELSKSHPDVKVGVFDATFQLDLNEKVNILTFPTTKLFIKGTKVPVQYLGSGDASDLANWVAKKVGRVSYHMASQSDIDETVKNNDLIALFLGSSESNAFENYVNVARLYDEVAFIDSNSNEVRTSYDIPEQREGLVVLNKQEKAVYTKPLDFEGIRRFINGQKYPVVAKFDRTTRHRIFEADEDVVILLRDKDEAGHSVSKEFEAAALELKDEIGFAEAILGTDLEVTFFNIIKHTLPNMLDVAKPDLPIVAVLKGHDNIRKYALVGNVTKENVIAFVKNFREDKIMPYLQSSAISEDIYEDDVRVVVGRDFSHVVFDGEKDVFVRFCTPAQKQCAQIAMITNRLATKLKPFESLMVAGFDTMHNHIPLMDKFDLPALVLFPKNDKENYILYKGEVTEANLLEFLGKNTGLKIEDLKESEKQETVESVAEEEKNQKQDVKADVISQDL